MTTGEADAIVIGGGVAGLAAAAELARADRRVILLEARKRLGGRVFTVRPKGWNGPVELGAEFVHGGNAELWALIRNAGIKTRAVPAGQWRPLGSKLTPVDNFWERIAAVMKTIDPKQEKSRSFAEFVRDDRLDLPEEDRRWARQFVEGFHAASTTDVPAAALAETESDLSEGQCFFPEGYAQLIEALAHELPGDRVDLRLGQAARAITWKRHSATVRAESAGGAVFRARAVIVTVPLGVLQTAPGEQGGIRFTPALAAKRSALECLRMGHVVRLTLRFDARAWRALAREALPADSATSFGFIQSGVEGLPVWWSLTDHSVLTGWAGGPAAVRLIGLARGELLREALGSLARVLKVSPEKVRAALRDWVTHDWAGDPFSRGAYSFLAFGAEEAAKQLRTPVAETLFFAGEATADPEAIGTVHGALATGRRAAGEVLAVK